MTLDGLARRSLAGFGAACALLAVGGTPALAEAADVRLGLIVGDVTVAAGHPAFSPPPVLSAAEPVRLAEPTITYELSGVTGRVQVDEDDEGYRCTAERPHRLVCKPRRPLVLDEDALQARLPAVVVRAAEGAKTGDSGKLTVTFAATGVKSVTAEGTVRVGDGVDLVGAITVAAKAAPGDRVAAEVTVRNNSEKVIDGAAAWFYTSYSMSSAQKFRNCTYHGDRLATCRFDRQLQPRATYRVTVPYELRPDTYAPGEKHSLVYWLTAAEFEDHTKYAAEVGDSIGAPGDGPVLELTEAVSTSGVPQTEIDPESNWTRIEVEVTGEQGADLAVFGDTVTGGVGDTVTARVGVANEGPASIDSGQFDDPVASVIVETPAGTTAVRVPRACDLRGHTAAGSRSYTCHTGPVLKVGERETFEFGLRIDKAIAKATGKVQLDGNSDYQDDPDSSNNAAELVVHSNGGQGGGLPITGPMAASMAAAGAALLLAGGAGVALARRRRHRFVA